MSDLKPCPWCGEMPQKEYDKIAEFFIYRCNNKKCPSTTYAWFNELQWQSRPIEDSLRKQLAIAMEAMTASINYQETRYLVTYKGVQITQEGSLILRDALAEIAKMGGKDE